MCSSFFRNISHTQTCKHVREIIENHVAHTFNMLMWHDMWHPAGTWANRFWGVANAFIVKGCVGIMSWSLHVFSECIKMVRLCCFWRILCSIFQNWMKRNEIVLEWLKKFSSWNEIEQPYPLNSLLAHVKLQGTIAIISICVCGGQVIVNHTQRDSTDFNFGCVLDEMDGTTYILITAVLN